MSGDAAAGGEGPAVTSVVGPIELVLVACGDPQGDLPERVERVAALLRERLAEALPAFDWRLAVRSLVRPGWRSPLEPVELISDTEVEEAGEGADFTLVITDLDLVAHYQPVALGAPSRATATGVASTCRLGEAAVERRLAALCLNLLARLNGLEPAAELGSFAARVEEPEDLDRMERLSAGDRAALTESLTRIADPRIEERGGRTAGRAGFYARALWENRREFLRALLRARPWLFPLHLSRLTTAALSTLLVLVMTAEAWDLALRQPGWRVALLSLAALAGTSAFVLRRQQLLIRRDGRRLTERRVLANVSTVAVVSSGFLATYLLLFTVTGGFAALFFDPALIASWAASSEGPVAARHYLTMAGFVASLGIVIGALGASFEARSHFRHVAFVDEEI